MSEEKPYVASVVVAILGVACSIVPFVIIGGFTHYNGDELYGLEDNQSGQNGQIGTDIKNFL